MFLKLLLCLMIGAGGGYAYVTYYNAQWFNTIQEQLLALSRSGPMTMEMTQAKDTRSNLRKLQARNSTQAAPCIVKEHCTQDKGMAGLANRLSDMGDRMDAVSTPLPSQIKPLFIQVEPAN